MKLFHQNNRILAWKLIGNKIITYTKCNKCGQKIRMVAIRSKNSGHIIDTGRHKCRN